MQPQNPYNTSDSEIHAEPRQPDDWQPVTNSGFDFQQALSGGWDAWKKQIWPAMGMLLVYILLLLLFYLVLAVIVGAGVGITAASDLLENPAERPALIAAIAFAAVIGSLLFLGALMPLNAGLGLSGLYIMRSQFSVGCLFVAYRRFLPIIATGFISFVIAMLIQAPSTGVQLYAYYLIFSEGGSIAAPSGTPANLVLVSNLISLPLSLLSLWVNIRFMLVPALIVERGAGIIQSFKVSWQLSSAYQWWLLLVMILTGVIVLAGMLACGIGVLFSAPLALTIYGAAIQQLLGESPAAGAAATVPEMASQGPNT